MITAPNEKITELFNTHADSLLRLCFIYLKDFHLAEDAVQETFMKAYRSLGGFKALSSEKTWLTRIAINCCKNIMRSKSYRENALELREQLPNGSGGTERNENRILVSAEISRLSVKYREVILLYYYSELTAAEIGKLLTLPRSTVEYRLRRAKSLLGQTLKEGYVHG